MKYLKSYNHYQNQVNEEGWLETIALSALLLFGNVEAKSEPTTTRIEQTVQEDEKINILSASTSPEPCSNLTLKKFGLVNSSSTFYTATVKDLKIATDEYIRTGDSTKILKNFKPIDYKGNSVDFLKIGNNTLSDSGFKSFDLTNDSDIIIASGNGLLALTRAVRGGEDDLKYSVLFVEMKSQYRRSESISYNPKEGTNISHHLLTMHNLLEANSIPLENFADNSYGKINLKDFLGYNDEKKVVYLTSYIDGLKKRFIPQDMESDMKQDIEKIQFTKMDPSIVKQYLGDVKKDGKVTPEKLESFKKLVIEHYITNYAEFTEALFGKKISNDLVGKMRSNLVTNYKKNISVTDKITATKIGNQSPEIKVSTKKYGLGQ